MAFENLSEKLQGALARLTGKGKINEKDLDEALREVRLALLEADVNFLVVREFIKKVKEKSQGEEVMKSLTPGQQVIKIVNEELVALMGESEAKLEVSSKPPTVIMLTGLQGAGKTTHAGKLAHLLKGQNKKPLLVAGDIYRPAAIDQLEVVGRQAGVPVFQMGTDISPVEIAKKGIEEAKKNANDVVIIDTAGRLHIDSELMDELKSIKEEVNPNEILLVVDAMTGQDAVNVAKEFNDLLDITGIILTKLDGDARGGAALSIRSVAKKPIKYIGIGEKLGDIEPFRPDRMASRILGMGDVLSLIEKAEQAIDEEEAKKLEEKILSQTYDLDDFLNQIEQMRNMGPLEDLIKMIPGMNSKALSGIQVDEKEVDRLEAMILSMTMDERRNPEKINNSRKKRITQGSGTTVQDLNRLLKQFKDSKRLMKQVGQMTKGGKRRGGGFNLPFFK